MLFLKLCGHSLHAWASSSTYQPVKFENRNWLYWHKWFIESTNTWSKVWKEFHMRKVHIHLVSKQFSFLDWIDAHFSRFSGQPLPCSLEFPSCPSLHIQYKQISDRKSESQEKELEGLESLCFLWLGKEPSFQIWIIPKEEEKFNASWSSY